MASSLLTSFDIWEPHHVTNSSDDLLEVCLQRAPISGATILRRLPVQFQEAPALVLQHMASLQPDIIVCCGMAETRTCLTVESGATWDGQRVLTSVDLESLVAGLSITQVSHDAGNFVCNYLYYSVLKSLKSDAFRKSRCIFVHVPILNPDNIEPIVLDFQTLLQRLGVRFSVN
jgi:pyroglutamyl-peptidase